MITKAYIKMCEQAGEIQEVCKYEGGEIFLNVAGEIEIMPFNLIEKMKEWYKYYYHVWLPTQEQLQEMMLNDYTIRAILGGVFYFGAKMDLDKLSMNEIWLAFVMKQKYNKIWTGKKWISI